MTIKTVGDLFEETDDWINDEEAMAFSRIEELIRDFKKDNGRSPTKIYVSNNEELQSYMMWFAPYSDLKPLKTEGDTFVCGHSVN